jgi:poly-gamma-glutamate capsule biosynthesis protein CapA/YwtB (metallophosphatase superfamily)
MRLALVGDVMLGRLVNEALKTRGPASPWGDTLPQIRRADWSFCNLECVISDLVPALLPDKTFHFRSDRKNVAVLTAAGIDAVSVANNHSLDFGPKAMLDMLATLDAEGIGHAGAGANLEAAMRPAMATSRDGTRVGLLACTDNEQGWAAGLAAPGVWFVPPRLDDIRAQQLLGRVQTVRRQADLVVVSLHWGGNWGRQPEPGHRELAYALVGAGAAVVFGHSCHVFRGIEVREGSPIVYSAGDFIDDYAVDPEERNDQSFVFGLEVDRAGIRKVRLTPTLIGDCQALIAHGREADEILGAMQRLCGTLGTALTIAGAQGTIVLPAAEAVTTHG